MQSDKPLVGTGALIRWLTAGVALIGVWGVLPIAYDQAAAVRDCPSIGAIPACYVVLLGYASIAVSSLASSHRTKLFFVGWTPLFLLAASGTTLELFGHTACPRSDAGVPICYFSFAMLLVLLGLFVTERLLTSGRRRNEGELQ